MPTRNVVLTTRHEKVIADLVTSGRYQNASEVLREGVRLIEEREARDAARLKILQDAAQDGFRDLETGRFIEIEDDALDTIIAELGQAGRGV